MRALAAISSKTQQPEGEARRRTGGPVSLSLPKDPALIAAARLTAAGVGLRAGLSFEAIEDLKVIVAEACTYCIQHGPDAGRLRITFELHPDAFVLLVADPQFHYSPGKRSDGSPLAAGAADELFIIRGLADELEYRSTPGNGLVLRITKNTD